MSKFCKGKPWPKQAHAFGETRAGRFDDNGASALRLSTFVKRLRASGVNPAELIRDAKLAGACVHHGVIADPIVAIATIDGEKRAAFGCPWCSDPKVLAAWEAEGEQERRS